MATTRRRRRVIRALVIVMVAVASVYFALTLALAPYVRHKLEQLVADHLHARLEIGSLAYRFPYGVTVRDASFTTDPQLGNVELLRVKRLDVALAELPFGKGPIVIQNISVRDPVIRIVREVSGQVLNAHLARRGAEAPPDWRKLKLSDVLRLRRFDVQRASITYDDRTRGDSVPMEWTGLSAHLRLQPASASRYDIHFAADNDPFAKLDLSASADVDAWTIDLRKLELAVEVKRESADARSPLPAPLQRVLHSLGADGTIRLQAHGDIPLKDPAAAQLMLEAQLDSIRVAPENRSWVLNDLTAVMHARVRDDVQFAFTKLDARGMGGHLQVTQASGRLAADEKSWTLDKLEGRLIADPASAPASAPASQPLSPTTLPSLPKLAFLGGTIDFSGSAAGSLARDQRLPSAAQLVATFDQVSLQPPRFPRAIERICGSVRLVDKALLVENAVGAYGPDQYTIAQAKLLLDDLPIRLEVTDLVAHAAVAQPGPLYPRPLDRTLAVLRPNGPFDITGAFSVYRGRGRNEPDYSLRIIPRGGGVTLTKYDLRVSDLQGELDVAPRLVSINYLEGSALGGTVAVKGTVVPRQPVHYDGMFSLQDIDVGALSLALGLIRDDGKPEASGRASARVRTRGEIPPRTSQRTWLDEVVARGGVRIDDGDLWSADVLSRIVGETKVAPEALTVSQAAAVFDARERQVRLSQFAISSPALGVQGSGTVGFNGALDLSVIAAPLGDWRQGMQKTGLPIVSDVAGEVVGAIQKLLNTATSKLLYEFRVEGNAKNPNISAVPTPMLTQNAAQLFESMLRGSRSDKLEEQIGGNDVSR